MFDILGVVGNLLLFALVFGMSATVDIKCMKEQVRNKKAILTGVFCQFIVLPFFGWLAVRLFDMDPAMGISLLVVTRLVFARFGRFPGKTLGSFRLTRFVCFESSPGGSYSNW